MTVHEFQEKIADILYREDLLDLDTPLNEIEEWDSVAYVAFVSMASEIVPPPHVSSDETSIKITASDIRKALTLRDLYELINRRRAHERS